MEDTLPDSKRLVGRCDLVSLRGAIYMMTSGLWVINVTILLNMVVYPVSGLSNLRLAGRVTEDRRQMADGKFFKIPSVGLAH